MHANSVSSVVSQAKDAGKLIRIFRKTLENFEANPATNSADFTLMREALFPYLRDAIFHKSAYFGSGIVICVESNSRRQFAHAVSTILGIRYLLQSELPVEVFFLGDKEPINQYDMEQLLKIPNVRVRDLTEELVGGNDVDLRPEEVRPFAMLASSFQHVILMDAESTFLQKPDVLLTSPKYLRTGALFFHDRTYDASTKSSTTWIRDLLRDPESADHLSFMTHGTAHELEAGVVVVDKHVNMAGLAASCFLLMNPEIRGQFSKVSYGDKESFWIGFIAVGSTFEFADEYNVAAVGKSEILTQDGNKIYEVCSEQTLHTDDDGEPLWLSGGLSETTSPGVLTKFDGYILESHATANDLCLFSKRKFYERRLNTRWLQKRRPGEYQMSAGKAYYLKWISLVTLVVQNSALVILMKYSRTATVTSNPSPPYLASTAVVLSEVIKLLICLVVYARELHNRGVLSVSRLMSDLFGRDSQWLKLCVPAVLYLVQNNLQYLAVTILDAATFQVTYQMKILTTALFSVIMLGKRLNRLKWLSLFILTAGIALVQLPTSSTSSTKRAASGPWYVQLSGLLAVAFACTLSGLAGVWFEKVLKGGGKGAEVSLWARNIQLSFFSVLPGFFIGVLVMDGEAYRQGGFFQGYTMWTYAAVLCQALGGLIVALVVKYADNILKGFASSISVILSCLASVYLFDFKITPTFVGGGALVLYATHLYSKPEKPKGAILTTMMDVSQSSQKAKSGASPAVEEIVKSSKGI
ncbi:MAG: hypothetical protein SGCHY_004320 [Lobulomycetales sp.]